MPSRPGTGVERRLQSYWREISAPSTGWPFPSFTVPITMPPPASRMRTPGLLPITTAKPTPAPFPRAPSWYCDSFAMPGGVGREKRPSASVVADSWAQDLLPIELA